MLQLAPSVLALAGFITAISVHKAGSLRELWELLQRPTVSAKEYPDTAIPTPEETQGLIAQVRTALKQLEGVSDRKKLDMISECLMKVEMYTNDVSAAPEQDGGTQHLHILMELHSDLLKKQSALLAALESSEK